MPPGRGFQLDIILEEPKLSVPRFTPPPSGAPVREVRELREERRSSSHGGRGRKKYSRHRDHANMRFEQEVQVIKNELRSSLPRPSADQGGEGVKPGNTDSVEQQVQGLKEVVLGNVQSGGPPAQEGWKQDNHGDRQLHKPLEQAAADFKEGALHARSLQCWARVKLTCVALLLLLVVCGVGGFLLICFAGGNRCMKK